MSRFRLYQDMTDPVVRRQRGAQITIMIAIVLDIGMGLWYAAAERISVPLGLYWAEAEATTVGSDVAPHTVTGHFIKAIVGVTVIPLFAATFSIFTTALTATHIHRVEGNIKQHVEARLKHHLGGGSDG